MVRLGRTDKSPENDSIKQPTCSRAELCKMLRAMEEGGRKKEKEKKKKKGEWECEWLVKEGRKDNYLRI